MASRPPKDSLIAIIGATGTGKSKLAIELALRYNGEIINSDAIQMYNGLPIITNKIPEHERHGVPHHLLDFIDLQEETWTVKHFVRESQKIIRDIRSKGKLPIVVGGTHYYVLGLLVKDSLVGEDSEKHDEGTDGKHDPQGKFNILSAPTADIYAKLQEVDPVMASRWHPMDRRKIQRSFEIFLQTGRKASDIYDEQRKKESSETTSSEMTEYEEESLSSSKFSDGMQYSPLIFWLDAQDAALKERLNARVHDMIRNGLIEEASSMADLEGRMIAQGVPPDKGKGIWVSIGYKELESFLTAAREKNTSEKELANLRTVGVEAVQASTRQYAKRQNRYVRLRFANAIKTAGAGDRLFLLDCSDLNEWQTAVTAPSQRVADSFLRGDRLPNPSDLSAFAKTTFAAALKSPVQQKSFQRICEVCHKTLMTEMEWQKHLTSRGHRNVLQGQRTRVNNELRRNVAQTRRNDTDTFG